MKKDSKERSAAYKTILFLQKTVLIFFSVLFVSVLISALTETAYFDPELYRQEHVLFAKDNLFLNVLGILIMAVLCVIFSGWKIRKKHTRMILGLLLFVSLAWVAVCQSSPGGDSAYVYNLAAELNHGNTAALQTPANIFYYTIYPFQFGMVMFIQACTFLFDRGGYIIVGLVNAVLLILSYSCLLSVAEYLSADGKPKKILLFLLAVSLQPLLMCTFCYGIIPSFSFTLFSILYFVKWLKNDSIVSFIVCVLFLSIAVILKQNALIIAIAYCIIILCQSVYRKRMLKLLLVIPVVLLPLAGTQLVQKHYERLGDVQYGEGLKTVNWFVLGSSDGEMGPGWDNSSVKYLRREVNDDTDMINRISEEKAAEIIEGFLQSPGSALSFYYRKNASQWTETTYQSIWVSKVKPHLGLFGDTYEIVYSHEYLLRLIMDMIAQFVYVSFFAGLLFLTGDHFRDDTDSTVLLTYDLFALIVLGGLLYHTVFEAKSQYILIYYMYMLPISSLGIYRIYRMIQERRKSADTI
ncbi:MAG: hypothetical protein IJJ29_12190 [Solobacterium sp.]|nr:hypothetical protein [Solobacterium sp.]